MLRQLMTHRQHSGKGRLCQLVIMLVVLAVVVVIVEEYLYGTSRS